MGTEALESMSESLQASVSRICSSHLDFDRCITVIGIICVNVDNSENDVMIKFNDCVTKADLFRLAKENCENSELAQVANKIVLSSQLLAALSRGIQKPPPPLPPPAAADSSPVATNGKDAGSTNGRKRKRPNPQQRRSDLLPDANEGDDEEDDDCSRDSAVGDCIKECAEEPDADELADLPDAEEEEEEDLPAGALQMNLDAPAETANPEVAAELAAIDEIDAATAAAAAVAVSSSIGSGSNAADPIVIRLEDDEDVEDCDELDDDGASVPPPAALTRVIKLTNILPAPAGSSGGAHHQAASELDLRALNQQLKGALGSKMCSSVFKCAYCGKSFNRKFCLERHERLHTGVKPYSCQICGERYIRLEDKKRHMRSAHPHDFMNYLDEDEMEGSPG